MFISNLNPRKIWGVSTIFIILFSVISFSGPVEANNIKTHNYLENDRLLINPNVKFKRLSTGIVVIYKTLENGKTVKHEFTDFYADVLIAAYRKQSFKQVVSLLSRKYYQPIDECRRELKHAIHILRDWDILVQGEVRL